MAPGHADHAPCCAGRRGEGDCDAAAAERGAWEELRDAAQASGQHHSMHSMSPQRTGPAVGAERRKVEGGAARDLGGGGAGSTARSTAHSAGEGGEVMRFAELQWLGTLGTYAATTAAWLQAHSPAAAAAARVRVHWIGASVGEFEGVCALEALLMHALPWCQVWRRHPRAYSSPSPPTHGCHAAERVLSCERAGKQEASAAPVCAALLA